MVSLIVLKKSVLSDLEVLLDDYKHYKSLVRISDIVWVRKPANRVAHTLAQQARSSDTPKLWSAMPDCTSALLLDEFNHE